MRSFTIGLVLMLFGALAGFSQDLTLKYGESVVNNDTIILTGTKATELIEVKISVTNNRETAVAIKLKKTEICIIEGTESSFCWGECYTPFVSVSPMAITIQPKATDLNSFVGDYRPFEMEGTSIVKYTFFDPADTTFQQSVTVFYQIGGSGVNIPGSFANLVRTYPNPADQFIWISLPDNKLIARTGSLVNIQGQVMITEEIPAGKREIRWPVYDLPAGVYFLRLRDENSTLTIRKICISH